MRRNACNRLLVVSASVTVVRPQCKAALLRVQQSARHLCFLRMQQSARHVVPTDRGYRLPRLPRMSQGDVLSLSMHSGPNVPSPASIASAALTPYPSQPASQPALQRVERAGSAPAPAFAVGISRYLRKGELFTHPEVRQPLPRSSRHPWEQHQPCESPGLGPQSRVDGGRVSPKLANNAHRLK